MISTIQSTSSSNSSTQATGQKYISEIDASIDRLKDQIFELKNQAFNLEAEKHSLIMSRVNSHSSNIGFISGIVKYVLNFFFSPTSNARVERVSESAEADSRVQYIETELKKITDTSLSLKDNLFALTNKRKCLQSLLDGYDIFGGEEEFNKLPLLDVRKIELRDDKISIAINYILPGDLDGHAVMRGKISKMDQIFFAIKYCHGQKEMVQVFQYIAGKWITDLKDMHTRLIQVPVYSGNWGPVAELNQESFKSLKQFVGAIKQGLVPYLPTSPSERESQLSANSDHGDS